MSVFPALQGFLLGGGLIIAIGAQNAFILRQGLLREHVFILCLVASVSDAFLIFLGVAGMGALVQSVPGLIFYVTVLGALFLSAYAMLAARRALSPGSLSVSQEKGGPLGRSLAILLAFTFFNPHVYLDTVILVGGIASQYMGGERLAFTIGAATASFVWFFSLGYGARLLAPLFERPVSWRILDGLIAIIMGLLALSLFFQAFG